MFALNRTTRVFLKIGATDLRLGVDGLYGQVVSILKQDALSGHVFGFCNRVRTKVKLLTFDGSGLWVCAQRLEGGRFAWPQSGVLAGMRNRVILGVRGGFLKQRQDPAVTSALRVRDRSPTQRQWNQEVVWRGQETDPRNTQAPCQKLAKTRRSPERGGFGSPSTRGVGDRHSGAAGGALGF